MITIQKKKVTTARLYAGGAAPNRIEISKTPLSASTTDKRLQVAPDIGTWENEATIGGKQVFTSRMDAGGAAPKHMKVPGTSLAVNNTDVEVQLAATSGTGRNAENLGKDNAYIKRLDAIVANALTSSLPRDLRMLVLPLASHGRTSSLICNPLTTDPTQVHPMESVSFAPSPTFPTCVQAVARRPNTSCGRCGLTVCQ